MSAVSVRVQFRMEVVEQFRRANVYGVLLLRIVLFVARYKTETPHVIVEVLQGKFELGIPGLPVPEEFSVFGFQVEKPQALEVRYYHVAWNFRIPMFVLQVAYVVERLRLRLGKVFPPGLMLHKQLSGPKKIYKAVFVVYFLYGLL